MIRHSFSAKTAFWVAVLCAITSTGLQSESLDVKNTVSAPGFSLPAIANAEDTLTLDQLKGSVTYLDFWASWCGPCRLSLPALDEIYQETSAQGPQSYGD